MEDGAKRFRATRGPVYNFDRPSHLIPCIIFHIIRGMWSWETLHPLTGTVTFRYLESILALGPFENSTFKIFNNSLPTKLKFNFVSVFRSL